MKTRFPILVIACSAVIALVVEACSSDSTATSVASAPAGPPSMSIVSPTDGSCAVLWSDESTVLRAAITTVNWSMRPPGYCGGYAQCGHVVAFADDVRVAEASALAIDVPLEPGDHKVRIELRDDLDAVGLDAQGKPLSDEIQIKALASGASCDAGAEAEASVPIDAADSP